MMHFLVVVIFMILINLLARKNNRSIIYRDDELLQIYKNMQTLTGVFSFLIVRNVETFYSVEFDFSHF